MPRRSVFRGKVLAEWVWIPQIVFAVYARESGGRMPCAHLSRRGVHAKKTVQNV